MKKNLKQFEEKLITEAVNPSTFLANVKKLYSAIELFNAACKGLGIDEDVDASDLLDVDVLEAKAVEAIQKVDGDVQKRTFARSCETLGLGDASWLMSMASETE